MKLMHGQNLKNYKIYFSVPQTHLNTNLVNCSNVVNTNLSAGFVENLLLKPGLHMHSSLYTCTVGVERNECEPYATIVEIRICVCCRVRDKYTC